jgi:hypothetical protein
MQYLRLNQWIPGYSNNFLNTKYVYSLLCRQVTELGQDVLRILRSMAARVVDGGSRSRDLRPVGQLNAEYKMIL